MTLLKIPSDACHNTAKQHLVLLLCLLAFNFSSVTAQPVLSILETDAGWPIIHITFMVECDGKTVEVGEDDVRVFQDGYEIRDVRIRCSSVQYAISAAFVCDASASMEIGNPTPLSGLKTAMHAFIDQMDGVLDEATIITFSNIISIRQSMTPFKSVLHSAVDNLNTTGGRALWDGAYAGILELINDGVNQSSSVILITSGEDDSSMRNSFEVIQLASRHRICVHTINVGSVVHSPELDLMAKETGGKFYHTADPLALHDIYLEIFESMRQGISFCDLIYFDHCADGKNREVRLQVLDVCGGSDEQTMTYQATEIPWTFSDLHMEIGKAFVSGSETARIPVKLITPIHDNVFPPFTFTLKYDTQHLHILGANTPPGSMLEGIPIDVTPVADGIEIYITEGRRIDGTGVLMEFEFQARNPHDTTLYKLHAVDPSFTSRCFIPHVEYGEIHLNMRYEPMLECTLDIPDIVIDESADERRYDPMPFPVSVTVMNTGISRSDYFSVELHIPDDLVLQEPGDAMQPGQRLQPREHTVLTWTLYHPDTKVEQQYDIRVTVYAPNGDTSTCEAVVSIPALLPYDFNLALHADGPVSICEGDSVTLDAGEGYASYRWNTGDRTRYVTVKRSGDFSCVVYTADTRRGQSDTLRVTMYPIPSPHLGVAGSLPVCEGDSVQLYADDGYSAYEWSTGETQRMITVKKPGVYYVTVSSPEGCIGYSDTLEVAVFPNPEKPVIYRSGEILFTVPAHRWQWFRYGRVIAEETEKEMLLRETGEYQVQITDENGCSAMSDVYIVSTLNVESSTLPARPNLSVWPDPADDVLNVGVNAMPGGHVRLLLSDMLGRTRTIFEGRLDDAATSFTIPLGDVARGPLFVLAFYGDAMLVRKVMKY